MLCKARGICCGCVWHLDLGGCRCPLVVLGSETRHGGELLPATAPRPATPRAALLWDEKGEGRWTAQWDSNPIFQRRQAPRAPCLNETITSKLNQPLNPLALIPHSCYFWQICCCFPE